MLPVDVGCWDGTVTEDEASRGIRGWEKAMPVKADMDRQTARDGG